MSILFADIFEAIRTLRACKGTSEKEILNYVQERVGGCLSVNNVLKTVCTLNKLVEEGVLVKKGKRYSLPKPPPKQDDDDMEQEEEKEEDCDNDDDNDNMKDSCDDLGGNGDDDDEEDCNEEGGDEDENKCGQEDDDDDDDDSDEDDDDDDDDDDEGCKNEEDDDDDDDNCNEALEGNGENKKNPCPEGEEEAKPNDNGNGAINGAGNGSPSSNGGSRSKSGNGELNCASSLDGKFTGAKTSSGRKSKKPSGTLTPTITPKPETIAFCVRDFMDSQYRPYSATDAFAKMEDVMEEEDQEIREKSKEVANIFQAKRRASRSKRSHLSNSNYRSRSPVKGTPPDPYQHRLAMEPSDDIGSLNNQRYQEPGDMELDVDPTRHAELIGVDYDLYRHRSTPQPSPGGVINRKDSRYSIQEKKEPKMEPGLEGINQCAFKRHGESAMMMAKGKEKVKKEMTDGKKEKHKREASHQKSGDDDMYGSLCSVCEKKKKKKI